MRIEVIAGGWVLGKIKNMNLITKTLLILLFISSCANKSQNENDSSTLLAQSDLTEEPLGRIDSIETIIGKIAQKDLEKKSSSFIRYSRNKYFAKEGYIFEDSDLSLFFKHQNYYDGTLNQSVNLDSAESKNVELLKSIENNYDSVEYSRIIHKFLFNGFPLYYIGWNPQIINNRPDEFFSAGFALLDTSMLWTLECNTIPPEYLIFKSKKFIDMIDDSHYLRRDNIEIKNIDKGCKKGDFDEIIIHLEGPSDDYNDVILGFDSQGEFSTLFDEFVTINKISKINDSIVEFNTKKRCDFIGTMFCDKKYTYNTITKETADLPYDFDKVEIITENNESVSLFSSPNTAINKLNDSIIGNLNPNTEVRITRFLDNEKCYMIKSDSLIGWVGDDQLLKFEVSFAD